MQRFIGAKSEDNENIGLTMKLSKKLLTNIWFYIILLALSIVIPFGINEIYKIGQDQDKAYLTLGGASDVFSFFGSYLSFFGSIVLGAVAVIQTADANEQAKEAIKQTKQANLLAVQMQQLEQAKFMSMISVKKLYIHQRSINSPNLHTPEMDNPINFDMIDWEYWPFTSCYHIDVLFENISDYPIVEFNCRAKGVNDNAKIRHGIKPAWNTVYISPHESQAIRLIIPSNFFEKYPQDGLQIDLEFVNVFDFHTFAIIKIEELSKRSIGNIKKGYAFQIHKITDVKPKELEKENAEE